MSSKPIALLVTVYNRQAKLERMLASVASEASLIDIIIVDDGSTPAIQLGSFSHLPIHLIRLDRNAGTMAAANAGLRYILDKNYEYVARLDSDDQNMPGRFAKQLEFLSTHPDIEVLGSHFEVRYPDGRARNNSIRPLSHNNIRRVMHIECALLHSTLLMRADALRRCGWYNEAMIAGGDYEFIWRLVKGCKVANHPQKLVLYECEAADSITTMHRRTQAVNALKVKWHNFNPLSLFSYIGAVYSLLDIGGLLRYPNTLKHWFSRPGKRVN